jgi:hypothetical protein
MVTEYWLFPFQRGFVRIRKVSTWVLQLSVPRGATSSVLPSIWRSKTHQSLSPGLHQAPLLGFPKIAPPSTWDQDIHSCSFSYRFPDGGRGFGLLLPRAGPVPSSRFLTALTVYSVSILAGLLHPAADPGVHRVPASSFLPCGFRIPLSTMLDPSKRFPRQQPSALRIPTL